MEAIADFGPLIVASDLERRLGEGSLRVLDCRFDLMAPDAGREAWLAGHIPGAVFVDLDRDLAGPVTPDTGRHPLPAVANAERVFGSAGIDANIDVVVYDGGSGGIAARAWWLLRWLGHERVALLDQGYAGWIAGGRSVESGEQRVEARSFKASVRDELVLTTTEIVDGGAETLKLVDARDAARYRGEVEPIDPVAGHVPGARSLPFTDNLEDGGAWKSVDAIRENIRSVVGDADEEWSVMCGSGVTACHLVVAALLAGAREPRVYAGSWSEWIRDPDRPIAEGT